MNLYLCLYSNGKYKKPKNILKNWASVSGCFDGVFDYDRDWLESTNFYSENIKILSDQNSKGDGWWLWKPYIIRESLNKIEEGDILFYLDASDSFFGDFRNFLVDYFSSHDLLLARAGMNRNSWYTKRDTFVYMNCDSPEYWESFQLEAGVIGVKKNQRTIQFIEEWMEYCKDSRIITNYPNESDKDNLPGFIDHRNDQSILTNLKVKWGETDNNTVMNYVLCNLWDFLLSGDFSGFNQRVNNVAMTNGGNRSYIFRSWMVNYILPLSDNIKSNDKYKSDNSQ